MSTATAKAVKPASSKKKVAGSGTATHPKYSEMVQQALTSLKERGGSSRQAILKYIQANFKVAADENMINAHVKMALKAGVKNGSLKQSKGTGASGSFRIGEVKKAPKKASVGPKKAAKNPSTSSAKKTTTTGNKQKPEKKETNKSSKPKASAKTKPEKNTTTKKAPSSKATKTVNSAVKKSPVKKSGKKSVVTKPPKAKAKA